MRFPYRQPLGRRRIFGLPAAGPNARSPIPPPADSAVPPAPHLVFDHRSDDFGFWAFEHEDLRLALGGRSAASFSDAVPILKYGMVICFVSGSSQAVASPQNVRASSKHGTLFRPSWLSHWCGTCKRTHGCPTGQRFLHRERLCPHPTCP